MNKKQKLATAIDNHGKNLIAEFNLDPTVSPTWYATQIIKLETRAHKYTTKDCNEGLTEREEALKNRCLVELIKLLKDHGKPVQTKLDALFINGDARGYALKIKEGHAEHIMKDWGGYGLLAPDFRD